MQSPRLQAQVSASPDSKPQRSPQLELTNESMSVYSQPCRDSECSPFNLKHHIMRSIEKFIPYDKKSCRSESPSEILDTRPGLSIGINRAGEKQAPLAPRNQHKIAFTFDRPMVAETKRPTPPSAPMPALTDQLTLRITAMKSTKGKRLELAENVDNEQITQTMSKTLGEESRTASSSALVIHEMERTIKDKDRLIETLRNEMDRLTRQNIALSDEVKELRDELQRERQNNAMENRNSSKEYNREKAVCKSISFKHKTVPTEQSSPKKTLSKKPSIPPPKQNAPMLTPKGISKIAFHAKSRHCVMK